MKIEVDYDTNIVIYPELSDNLIQIENPGDKVIALLSLSSVDKMISALQQAKQILEG